MKRLAFYEERVLFLLISGCLFPSKDGFYQPKLVRWLVLGALGAVPVVGFDTLKAELLPFGLRSKFKILPEDRPPREEFAADESSPTNGFTRLDCPPA